MSTHYDWTTVSDDPNNSRAKREVKAHLLAMRQVHLDTDLLGFVINAARDKRVLDIGVVEHAARYVDREGWRHGHIHRVAARCVGVDILEPLVQELNLRGFDVHCVDATSEADLGERFDFIFIGDVVEHVDNPVALLRFAKRHLASGGHILVATPNPFSRKFFRRFRRDGTAIVNLDHLAWFTPTMALELGRRAGLSLRAYHLIKPISGFRRAWKQLAWRYTPVEYSFPDFIFEYSLPQPEVD
jgi:2-polyprenyl-3-methyl-5-hydroxy-6-metoxy-1,4-benzoquinol methylase